MPRKQRAVFSEQATITPASRWLSCGRRLDFAVVVEDGIRFSVTSRVLRRKSILVDESDRSSDIGGRRRSPTLVATRRRWLVEGLKRGRWLGNRRCSRVLGNKIGSISL